MPGSPAVSPRVGAPRYDNATDEANFAAQVNAVVDAFDAAVALVTDSRFTDTRTPSDASVTTVKLAVDVASALPRVGSTMGYGGVADPSGSSWMLADGRLIDRTTYAEYFAVVGHRYNGGVDPGANKVRIQDKRGRVSVGPHNMGTAQGAANRLVTSNRVAGQSGGEEKHLNSSAESGMPTHGHTASSGNDTPDHTHDYQNWGANTAVLPDGTGIPYLDIYSNATTNGANQRHTHPITVNAAAGASAASGHNNMQPYEVENVIVRVL